MQNRETNFPISNDLIVTAERSRVAGKLREAIEITQPVSRYSLEEFPSLTIQEQQQFFMAMGILTNATLGLANRSLWVPTAVHHLSQVRDLFVTRYQDQNVTPVLQTIKEDSFGNEYDFYYEKLSAEASYLVTLFHLSGNPALLEEAITRYDECIELSQEPTAQSLAAFTKNRLLFQQDKSYERFIALKESYEKSIEASSAIQRWERVATVSARLFLDAQFIGSDTDMNKAYKTFEDAVEQDPSCAQILDREERSMWITDIRNSVWRSTRLLYRDYKSLELPTSN